MPNILYSKQQQKLKINNKKISKLNNRRLSVPPSSDQKPESFHFYHIICITVNKDRTKGAFFPYFSFRTILKGSMSRRDITQIPD